MSASRKLKRQQLKQKNKQIHKHMLELKRRIEKQQKQIPHSTQGGYSWAIESDGGAKWQTA